MTTCNVVCSGAEDRGGQLVAMDTAMLGLWLQHSR